MLNTSQSSAHPFDRYDHFVVLTKSLFHNYHFSCAEARDEEITFSTRDGVLFTPRAPKTTHNPCLA
jgi:hypothetical protein